MGTVKTSLLLAGIVIASSAWAGCSSEEDIGSAEGAATAESKCNVFDQQKGGAPMTPQKLGELAESGDPVAKKILASAGANDTCARTYSDILARLKKNDNKDCDSGDGLGSFLINERVAFQSEAQASKAGFRTVIRKACDGRGENGLLFSATASAGDADETNVEMIGRTTDGIFNYYELTAPGQYVFFGSSKDFIQNGYDCDGNGVCVSRNSKQNGDKSGKSCASCHVGGGLVMKELASPWLHWTAGFPNGSAKVVEAQKAKLGEQQAGENLEFNVVRASFDSYNERRIDLLAEKGIKELLRPVACTLDVNLDSGLGSGSLAADQNLTFGSFNMDSDLYNTLKKSSKVKQTLASIGKDDTAFEFTFPKKGGIDENYATKLVEKGLIDEKTLANILAVDFTRPIFSAKRCALINALPNTVDADLAAYAKATGGAKTTKAKDIAKKIPGLFGSSIGSKTKDAITKEVDKFFEVWNGDKCLGSADKTVKENAHLAVMTYASNVRRKMAAMQGKNGQGLIEQPGTMLTSDSLPVTDDALNPELVDGKCVLNLKK
jgi:hypothetical protein